MNIYTKILLLTLFLFVSSCSIIDEYVGTSDDVAQSDEMDHEHEEEHEHEASTVVSNPLIPPPN